MTESVHEVVGVAAIVLRTTMAGLVSMLALRARQRALWLWAAAWWAAVPLRTLPEPDGLISLSLATVLVAVTWRGLLRSGAWVRSCALLGLVALVAVAVLSSVGLVHAGIAAAVSLPAELLVGCAVILAPLEQARRRLLEGRERLAETERRLHRAVNWDPLTECSTRPAFRELVDNVRAGRDVAHGAILVVDMDGLKRINDLSGHSAGDKAIRRTGLAIKSRLGANDLALRWGGDEFVVVVRGATLWDGRQARRRILAAIRREGLSASAGLAVYGPENDVVRALREADARMYAMKRRRQAARMPMPRQLSLPLEAAEEAAETLPPDTAPVRAET